MYVCTHSCMDVYKIYESLYVDMYMNMLERKRDSVYFAIRKLIDMPKIKREQTHLKCQRQNEMEKKQQETLERAY